MYIYGVAWSSSPYVRIICSYNYGTMSNDLVMLSIFQILESIHVWHEEKTWLLFQILHLTFVQLIAFLYAQSTLCLLTNAVDDAPSRVALTRVTRLGHATITSCGATNDNTIVLPSKREPQVPRGRDVVAPPRYPHRFSYGNVFPLPPKVNTPNRNKSAGVREKEMNSR